MCRMTLPPNARFEGNPVAPASLRTSGTVQGKTQSAEIGIWANFQAQGGGLVIKRCDGFLAKPIFLGNLDSIQPASNSRHFRTGDRHVHPTVVIGGTCSRQKGLAKELLRDKRD